MTQKSEIEIPVDKWNKMKILVIDEKPIKDPLSIKEMNFKIEVEDEAAWKKWQEKIKKMMEKNKNGQ